jgi:ubiquinone/menaquinone biosynthesis C-methylase UbiE
MTAAAFDTLATRYDELWTHSAVGRSQRSAVWRTVDRLFQAGDKILDLGCGTGEDALHLMSAGMQVSAIDSSSEMVRVARNRGVNANVLPIELIGEIDGQFDGVLSDFGALNCVPDMGLLRAALARLVRPGGYLVVCLIGRFCGWETGCYLLRGQPRKAIRRWNGKSVSSSLGVTVHYPSLKRTHDAFAPEFTLLRWSGVGLFVPPSYIGGLSPATIAVLDSLDRHTSHLPLLRAAADHRLFTFVRR